MIPDMRSNKNFNLIITELNISLVFTILSYFVVPKNIRQNSTHYFVMDIPSEREFSQIAFNHSSDDDLQDFMNLYKKCIKCIEKNIFFFGYWYYSCINWFSRFRKNLLGTILNLILTIDEKSEDKKLQYDIDREAAKISALSSGKIDNSEYLTGEEILPSD